MTEDYSIPRVRAAAGAGLDGLYHIAKADVRRRWRKMDASARANACRGLVEIRHMAQNPELHFSRDATYARWHENAQRYVACKSMIDLGSAMYLVDGPADAALQLAGGALSDVTVPSFRSLCNAIVKWEYEWSDLGTARAGYTLGRRIMDTSRQITRNAAFVSACRMMRVAMKRKMHVR